ncbi:hypothetical protein O181_021034 [Austropuccinia psidii MF-1]|uniref:Uncharacterized protein n=1 Tax=Austropuccinia psidii MF-1 TaxID=1389203 RepID=A0A9Q3CA15_9BASI|nr:hypothetical protein [Austropuccinia psidii MF-1]
MNEVYGFSSHYATSFCTWFKCTKAQLHHLEMGHLCKRRIVSDYSKAFKQSKTQSEADWPVKKSGIWWSELNQLPYWDPVQYTSLGILHLWFEGILQHNFIKRWKWTVSKTEERDTSENKSRQN